MFCKKFDSRLYKKIFTKLGNARRHNGRFLPQILVNHPKNKFPKSPPKHIILTIHETSSVEIGPDDKCESSDLRNGKLADGHPQLAPKAMAIKFAGMKQLFTNIINLIYLVKYSYHILLQNIEI